MKLIHHFAFLGFSNTYLLGPDGGDEAILIDPGVMDIRLLELIEKNGLYVKHVLVTHHHRSHVNGIRTLKKIYDFNIYCAGSLYDGVEQCVSIGDGTVLRLGDFTVRVIGVTGHSHDSVAFLVENHLFTGDVMSAGRLGSTPTYPQRIQMLHEIEEKLMPLPPETLVFPGHGPPTTLQAERDFNPYLNGSMILPRRDSMMIPDNGEY